MLKRLFIVGFVLYLAGFALFANHLPTTPRKLHKVDGIVVLTGGGSRLDAAVSLLEKRKGERLLISGVNPQTSKRVLKTHAHGKKRFDCCADLGYAAENTQGNAEEAAAWTRFHRYKRILLVTSRYHMPRSLLEFRYAMPGVTIVAYPVDTDTGEGLTGRWRRLRLLHGEYLKYLAVAVLTRLGLEPGLDRDASAAESRL